MIKIGLLGSDSATEKQLEIVKSIKDVEIIGIYDSDTLRINRLQRNTKIQAVTHLNDLIGHSDALIIGSTQLPVFHLASLAVKNSKHLFLNQPFQFRFDQIVPFMDLASEAHVLVQPGMNERFNPAYIKATGLVDEIQYIELSHTFHFESHQDRIEKISRCLAEDIDLISHLVNAGIKKTYTAPVFGHDDLPMMINIRLEFNNGVVANLDIGSRLSHKERKIIVYQSDARIHIDLLNQHLFTESHEPSLKDEPLTAKKIQTNYHDPSKEALHHFIRSVRLQTEPKVTLDDLLKALQTKQAIEQKFMRVRVL